MKTVIVALPIRPGKLEAWIRFTQTLMDRRRVEYEASRRRLGIKREYFSLVPFSGAPMAMVLLEMAEPQQLWTWLARAERPFARWVRRQLQELHGIDASQTHVMPEPITSWKDPGRS